MTLKDLREFLTEYSSLPDSTEVSVCLKGGQDCVTRIPDQPSQAKAIEDTGKLYLLAEPYSYMPEELYSVLLMGVYN